MMERKTCLKQLFAGRSSVFAELKNLHAAYVKSAAHYIRNYTRKNIVQHVADTCRHKKGPKN